MLPPPTPKAELLAEIVSTHKHGTTIHIHCASEEASRWVSETGQIYGSMVGLGLWRYSLLVSPLYTPDDVVAYFRSYAENNV